jgi:hypothetical protein
MWSIRLLPRLGRQAASALTIAAALAGCAGHVATLAPSRVAVDARPNGIAVRPDDGAVLITDDGSNSILLSTDGRDYVRYLSVPVVAGQPNGLSALTFAGDHALLVARFGFGAAGGLFEIASGRSASTLDGLDPARRRLGLATIGPGKVLSSWFIKDGNQPPRGGVSLIDYDPATHAATERDLLTGLGKPVGVAVFRGRVFVADQENNRIVEASLDTLLNSASPRAPDGLVAQIDSPDLLAVDKRGVLYTKCRQRSFCKVTPDGGVTELAGDFENARGVALDENRARLYVIDRAKSAEGTSYVRTFPLK